MAQALSVIERVAGIDGGSPVHAALMERAGLMELGEASHDAVLTPREPGGLSHGLRAAIAVRAAAHAGDRALGDHYREKLMAAADGPAMARLSETGTTSDDPRLAAIIAHADLLTLRPREATRADIERLVAAGVAEADIVRLAELCAFLAWQIRVIAGLRLMGSGQ